MNDLESSANESVHPTPTGDAYWAARESLVRLELAADLDVPQLQVARDLNWATRRELDGHARRGDPPIFTFDTAIDERDGIVSVLNRFAVERSTTRSQDGNPKLERLPATWEAGAEAVWASYSSDAFNSGNHQVRASFLLTDTSNPLYRVEPANYIGEQQGKSYVTEPGLVYTDVGDFEVIRRRLRSEFDGLPAGLHLGVATPVEFVVAALAQQLAGGPSLLGTTLFDPKVPLEADTMIPAITVSRTATERGADCLQEFVQFGAYSVAEAGSAPLTETLHTDLPFGAFHETGTAGVRRAIRQTFTADANF